MKQKTKWLKPRVWIPLLALLLFYIGCGVYIVAAGRVNTIRIMVSKTDYVVGSQRAVSSDESVMRIRQITEEKMDDNALILNIEAEHTGTGEATLLHTFDMTDIPGDFSVITPVSEEYAFYATPFGVLYNKTYQHFNGIETLLVLAVGTMLIVSAACVFSVLEKYRCGAFSYSMVVRCGLIIFLTVNEIIITVRWMELLQIAGQTDIRYIIEVLFNSAKTFVTLSALPLGALALALALSNVQLVRREGFRVMNLLGIFIGIVMMGGIALLHRLNNYLAYDSLAAYYISTFVTLAFAYLYVYFECMLLSTILCAVLSTRYKPPYSLDYIIILGCAIRADGTPTPLLRGRAERALAFEREQFAHTGRHAKFVPSGGQGSDEIISEAASMKRWLTEQLPKHGVFQTGYRSRRRKRREGSNRLFHHQLSCVSRLHARKPRQHEGQRAFRQDKALLLPKRLYPRIYRTALGAKAAAFGVCRPACRRTGLFVLSDAGALTG